MKTVKRLRRRERIRENRRRLSAKRTGRLLIVLIFVLMTTVGCTGGGGGILGIDQNVDKLLEDGWHELRNGENDRAIVKFTDIIHGAADESEETSANTGLGWAYANVNDVDRAIAYFSKVENKSNDANVGYAAVLLNRGNDGDYYKALKLLKNIHLDNPNQSYYSENRLNLTDADVHAPMAIAFYYNGYNDEAVRQIRKARDLDYTGANDRVNKIYKALVEDLNIESN